MGKLLSEIFDAYAILEFSDDDDVERKKRYLDELRDYALSGTYTNAKYKEYFLKNILKPVSKQMTDLGLSQSAVYKNREKIERDLERRVGKDIVKNILAGRFDEVEKVLTFSISDQPIGNVILSDVVDTIRKRAKENRVSKNSTYDLYDCIDEIKFLKKYSVLDLEVELNKLSLDKLSYLIRLISFEESNVIDRGTLLEIIKK